MAKTYSLWFRKTYQLAPTDKRYLAMTPEDIEAEYWAYHVDSKKAGEEFSDDDFSLDDELAKIEAEAEAEAAAAPPEAPAPEPESAPLPDDWEDVPE
jgi:hypothetical protein